MECNGKPFFALLQVFFCLFPCRNIGDLSDHTGLFIDLDQPTPYQCMALFSGLLAGDSLHSKDTMPCL
jgi:hypothetical protein